MPNLINVLASFTPSKVPANDEERRKLVQAELKAGGQGAMEWGTCMIFSCEKDCCEGNDTAGQQECWREENVLIQWDNTC
jgi:pre-rRNA-processing protein TSR4